jgi:hypothetical protein
MNDLFTCSVSEESMRIVSEESTHSVSEEFTHSVSEEFMRSMKDSPMGMQQERVMRMNHHVGKCMSARAFVTYRGFPHDSVNVLTVLVWEI